MEKFKLFLKSISHITDQEFAETISYFTEQKLRKDDFFVKSNNVCRHIAFILKGTLRTYYSNNKAEDVTACFCTEDSLTTSYKSFILQQPSKLSLQAIEDTLLLVIDYSNLQHLYVKSPVWQAIGRVVAEREYMIVEQYAAILNNETAKEKYLRLLTEQPSILQKASIEDIASYLGVTRRTLSRIRQEISRK